MNLSAGGRWMGLALAVAVVMAGLAVVMLIIDDGPHVDVQIVLREISDSPSEPAPPLPRSTQGSVPPDSGSEPTNSEGPVGVDGENQQGHSNEPVGPTIQPTDRTGRDDAPHLVYYPGFEAIDEVDPQHEVQGTVVDRWGRPLAGARVEVLWVLEYPSPNTPRRNIREVIPDREQDENLVWWAIAETKSDTTGSFRLNVPPGVALRIRVWGEEAGNWHPGDPMQVRSPIE